MHPEVLRLHPEATPSALAPRATWNEFRRMHRGEQYPVQLLSRAYRQYKHYRGALEALRINTARVRARVEDMQLVLSHAPFLVTLALDDHARGGEDPIPWDACETCTVLWGGQWRLLMDRHTESDLTVGDIVCAVGGD